MMRIFQSKDYHHLATALAETLKEGNSVFSPHFLVTGHYASQQWLREYIANANGIVAQLHSKTLEAFWDMIYHVLEAGPARAEMMRPTQLAWLIDGVLADSAFLNNPQSKVVADYVDGDPMRRFGLAEKLADLFGQYQLLHPDMLEGSDEATDPHIAWQRLVWKEVRRHAGDSLPDRNAMLKGISEALNNPAKVDVLAAKVPYVYIFGTHWWTAPQLELLYRLGDIIRLDVFQLNIPASEHPLFQYLGAFQQKQTGVIGKEYVTELEEVSTSPNNDTVLRYLQDKIRNPETAPKSFSIPDDSIVVSSHYGTFREVEGLYHYIVRQLEVDKDLNPREICVVVPNPAQYATAVRSYFSNEAFPVPYTLFEGAIENEASPRGALEALLDLDETFAHAREVIDLLRFEHIRSRFGITDVERVRKAAERANILKGFKNDDPAKPVSWQYGLKRLIYGFCMSPQEHLVDDGESPFYTVIDYEDSTEMNELLRLYIFAEKLHTWAQERGNPRNLTEWVQFLQEKTLDRMLSLNPEEDTAFTQILSEMAQLADLELFANYTLPYKVIRHHLKSRLAGMNTGNLTGYGGVRFISPHYTLSTPAKIYAFLGLNSDTFPRREFTAGFDLLGDKRLEATDLDKHVLLTILLSATHKCYFSYQSHILKDNSPNPAGGFVDALLHSMAECVAHKSPKDLIIAHPLDALHERYNSEEGLYRYDNTPRPEAEYTHVWLKPTMEGDKSDAPDDTPFIELDDMISYMKAPVDYYYKRVLKIYLKNEATTFDTKKIYGLNTLEGWKIKGEILRRLKANNLNEAELKATYTAKGELPVGQFGINTFDKYHGEVEAIYDNFIQLTNGWTPLAPEEIIYTTDSNREIRGKIDGLYEDSNGIIHFVFDSVSKKKLKYQLEAVSKFCLVKTKYPSSVFHYVCPNYNRQPNLNNPGEELLNKLSAYYIKRKGRLLPFTWDGVKINFKDVLASSYDLHLYYSSIMEDSFVSPSQEFKREVEKGVFLQDEHFKAFKEVYDNILPLINFLED